MNFQLNQSSRERNFLMRQKNRCQTEMFIYKLYYIYTLQYFSGLKPLKLIEFKINDTYLLKVEFCVERVRYGVYQGRKGEHRIAKTERKVAELTCSF